MAKCRRSLRARLTLLHAVTNEEGWPQDDTDESGTKLCSYWADIFKTRIMLNYVQRDLGDIYWTQCKEKFDEMFATKIVCPGLGQLAVSDVVAVLVAKFFSMRTGSPWAEAVSRFFFFASSKTVFIPKSATADDQGRIVILTTPIWFGLWPHSISCVHPAQRCVTDLKTLESFLRISLARTPWLDLPRTQQSRHSCISAVILHMICNESTIAVEHVLLAAFF